MLLLNQRQYALLQLVEIHIPHQYLMGVIQQHRLQQRPLPSVLVVQMLVLRNVAVVQKMKIFVVIGWDFLNSLWFYRTIIVSSPTHLTV